MMTPKEVTTPHMIRGVRRLVREESPVARMVGVDVGLGESFTVKATWKFKLETGRDGRPELEILDMRFE